MCMCVFVCVLQSAFHIDCCLLPIFAFTLPPPTMASKANLKGNTAALDEIQQGFVRKAQRMATEEASKSRMIKARNRFSGLLLATFIGSIYAYTIFTVKQEKFLDELDDLPPTESNK